MATSALLLGAAPSGFAGAPRGPLPGVGGTPATIVFQCFQIVRGPDPSAVVRAQTLNFGFDTVVVRQAARMCEPALKLPGNTDLGNGTVVVQPNATLTLGTDAGPDALALDGALGLVATAMSPVGGLVLASSLNGGGMIGGSFFDVSADLTSVGAYQADSFFDITYRLAVMGGAPPVDVMLHLVSKGGGVYTSQLPTPISIGGTTFTNATLTLNDPTTPGTTRPTRVLECFRIQRGADPNDPYRLTTKNFGADNVLVRQATTLCEGALKTKAQIPPGTDGQLPAPFVAWECFAIPRSKNQNTAFRFFTANFGAQRGRVQRGVELCEDAAKVRTDAAGVQSTVGRADGRVYECFKLDAKNPTAPFWLTNRNFGPAPVVVKNSVVMCERAVKDPLPTFPPNRPGDTGNGPGPTPGS